MLIRLIRVRMNVLENYSLYKNPHYFTYSPNLMEKTKSKRMAEGILLQTLVMSEGDRKMI